MKLSLLKSSLIYGGVSGILSASIISLIVTTLEWFENPNGIFFDASNGTNWTVVYDTAVSWFVPVCVVVSLVVTALIWIYLSTKSPRNGTQSR